MWMMPARALTITNKLKLLIPSTLPVDDVTAEPSVIFHDDLFRHNSLIDDYGPLHGILDWESICSSHL